MGQHGVDGAALRRTALWAMRPRQHTVDGVDNGGGRTQVVVAARPPTGNPGSVHCRWRKRRGDVRG